MWAACPLEHSETSPDFLPLSSNVSFDFPDACHPASAAADVPRDAADAGVLHEAWGGGVVVGSESLTQACIHHSSLQPQHVKTRVKG